MNKHIRITICVAILLFGLFGAAMADGYPSSGAAVPEEAVLLQGTVIGEKVGYASNESEGCSAAFDGEASTFYNPTVSGAETSY